MGQNIVLGVTGSIAAYKAIDLASRLTKQGHSVHCVLTADALHFVTALSFKTLTRLPVISSLYEQEHGWQPSHIELADKADILIIAPATANIIAKLALGISDDALTCIALALNPAAKVFVAPAMNGKMWQHPATQLNANVLRSRGVQFIGPDEGLLSCGYEGVGRMSEPEQILQSLQPVLGGG